MALKPRPPPPLPHAMPKGSPVGSPWLVLRHVESWHVVWRNPRCSAQASGPFPGIWCGSLGSASVYASRQHIRAGPDGQDVPCRSWSLTLGVDKDVSAVYHTAIIGSMGKRRVVPYTRAKREVG